MFGIDLLDVAASVAVMTVLLFGKWGFARAYRAWTAARLGE